MINVSLFFCSKIFNFFDLHICASSKLASRCPRHRRRRRRATAKEVYRQKEKLTLPNRKHQAAKTELED